MSKISILAAGTIGYVLGARAGRDRYEQIKTGAQKVAQDPRVRKAADQATDKAGGVASAAAQKARRDSSISATP